MIVVSGIRLTNICILGNCQNWQTMACENLCVSNVFVTYHKYTHIDLITSIVIYVCTPIYIYIT